jgi:hypothetical protein
VQGIRIVEQVPQSQVGHIHVLEKWVALLQGEGHIKVTNPKVNTFYKKMGYLNQFLRHFTGKAHLPKNIPSSPEISLPCSKE